MILRPPALCFALLCSAQPYYALLTIRRNRSAELGAVGLTSSRGISFFRQRTSLVTPDPTRLDSTRLLRESNDDSSSGLMAVIPTDVDYLSPTTTPAAAPAVLLPPTTELLSPFPLPPKKNNSHPQCLRAGDAPPAHPPPQNRTPPPARSRRKPARFSSRRLFSETWS